MEIDVHVPKKVEILNVSYMVDNILRNFIKGLKKSFDGKDYLRNISECNECGKPSFCVTCQFCETTNAYKKSKSQR